MKKLAFLFAMLLAAFAIAACGDDNGSTSGDTSPAAGAVEEVEEGAEEAGDEIEDKAGEAKEEAEEAGASGEVHIEADPDGALAYTEDSATAEAGKVKVHLTNEAPVPHDVRIEDEAGKDVGGTEVITQSEESTTVNLKPGEYTFYCSVPGHREAGMEGTLTVE